MDYVLVRALAGGTLRLENPWPSARVAVAGLEGGESTVAGSDLLLLETRPGSDYLLRPAATVMERIPVADFAHFGLVSLDYLGCSSLRASTCRAHRTWREFAHVRSRP